MRRRQLLAALGGGAMTTIAGCGYAYGGGDLREEIRVPGAGTAEDGHLFVRMGEHVVTARSGLRWIRDGDGEMQFTVGTTVRRFDRHGVVDWQFNHFEGTRALAIGDRAFLLEEKHLVASAPIDAPIDYDGRGRPIQTERAWRMHMDDALGQLAAVEDLVVAATHNTVVGMRDGEERWSLDTPDPVAGVEESDGCIYIRTTAGLICANTTGTTVWERDVTPEAAVGLGPRRVIVHDSDELRCLSTNDGAEEWTLPLDGPATDVVIGPTAAFVRAASTVHAIDFSAGSHRWSVETGIREPAGAVPAEDAVYLGSDRAVYAIDGDGRRWHHPLEDVEDDPAIDGWIANDRVALLYPSGRLLTCTVAMRGVPCSGGQCETEAFRPAPGYDGAWPTVRSPTSAPASPNGSPGWVVNTMGTAVGRNGAITTVSRSMSSNHNR